MRVGQVLHVADAGGDEQQPDRIDVAPNDATDDEIDTVAAIRAQLNPNFTVAELRDSRATAISEALTIATGFDAAGRPDQARVYRVLAVMLEHARRGRTLPCPHPNQCGAVGA